MSLRETIRLVALDATTGKEIWIHEALTGIAPRGINYWESKEPRTAGSFFKRIATSKRSMPIQVSRS